MTFLDVKRWKENSDIEIYCSTSNIGMSFLSSLNPKALCKLCVHDCELYQKCGTAIISSKKVHDSHQFMYIYISISLCISLYPIKRNYSFIFKKSRKYFKMYTKSQWKYLELLLRLLIWCLAFSLQFIFSHSRNHEWASQVA